MSTDTATQNHRVIDDERLIDVVTERAHAGAVDGAEGGVAPPEIVDALEGEFHRSSIAKRARDLAENGRLKAVWGIGPMGPRQSYLPVEREIRTDGGHDEWLSVEAEAERGTGPATAAILESVAEVLRKAPEGYQYDLDLSIDEHYSESEIRTDGGHAPRCDRHGCEELAHPGLEYCSFAHARGVSR